MKGKFTLVQYNTLCTVVSDTLIIAVRGNHFIVHYNPSPAVVRKTLDSEHASFLGCFMSQQNAKCIPGTERSTNLTQCHTETKAADKHAISSSHSTRTPGQPVLVADPGAWEDGHERTDFYTTGTTRRRKARTDPGIPCSRGGRLITRPPKWPLHAQYWVIKHRTVTVYQLQRGNIKELTLLTTIIVKRHEWTVKIRKCYLYFSFAWTDLLLSRYRLIHRYV